MMFTVSSAAAEFRSTQNTCAPSRAKVTAVALPLPQPGPIEPAPTTIAVLSLSRSIDFLSRYRFLVARESETTPGNPVDSSPGYRCAHPGYGSLQTRNVVT